MLFVGNLHLHRFIVDTRDLPVDPAGGDDLVTHLQRFLEFLDLLLPALHRQEDHEVEDAENQGEGQELHEPVGALGVDEGAIHAMTVEAPRGWLAGA